MKKLIPGEYVQVKGRGEVFRTSSLERGKWYVVNYMGLISGPHYPDDLVVISPSKVGTKDVGNTRIYVVTM